MHQRVLFNHGWFLCPRCRCSHAPFGGLGVPDGVSNLKLRVCRHCEGPNPKPVWRRGDGKVTRRARYKG